MVPPGETEHKDQNEDIEEHKVGVDIPPAEPAPQLPGIRGVQEEEEPPGRHQGNAAHRPFKTRAKTAQTKAYSENHLQSRQLQTEKTVADF